MNSVNERTAEFRSYPPVARLTTRGQWLVVACILLLVAYGRHSDVIMAVGYTWQVFVLHLVDTGWLLALAWAVWHVFDRIPFALEHRWRNGALRVLLAGVLVKLDAIFFRKLAQVELNVQVHTHQDRDAVYYSLLICAIIVLAHMILQRSHEQQQQIALKRSLTEAQLHALSLELQPHFLFNTMNGIAALVRDNPTQAERMLLQLSDLLRLTLRKHPDGRISLREELEQLDLYLDLQMMRFGSRLTVTREIDPATLDGQVPHMLLQPLVENALTHGIAPRVGPGHIALTARREKGALVLKVSDDGVGLSPTAQRYERTGIGTTRARLAAMFGDDQSFILRPAESGGTEVIIHIPFLRGSG